jgi:hypothetical protein
MKQAPQLENATEKEKTFSKALDSLINSLTENDFDEGTVNQFQKRFNDAIEHKRHNAKQIGAFKALDEKGALSRSELLDEFSILLQSNKIDSNFTRKYIRGERIIKITLILTAIVMITLGFAMIVMPAPPYFEMFTIYYFSLDDGVTLMDLISLIIILAGIYVLVRAINKKIFDKK